MDFTDIDAITIPEGDVERITETSTGRVLWEKASPQPEHPPAVTYPPDILTGQSFTLNGDRANSCTIQGTNVTPNSNVTSVTWSTTGLPAGISLGTTDGKLTGTPTVIGNYSPSVTVVTEHGRDTETVNLSIPFAQSFVPTITSNTEYVCFSNESMPEYIVPYTWTKPPSTANWSVSWGGNMGALNITLNNSTGAFSSSAIRNVSTIAGLSVFATVTYRNGASVESKTSNTAGFSVYVVSRGTNASWYLGLGSSCLLCLMGLPAGLVTSGGSGDVQYVLFAKNNSSYNNTAYEVPSNQITLTGSNNLTISGSRVTVNSAGSCWLRAVYTGDTSKTVTTRWTANSE